MNLPEITLFIAGDGSVADADFASTLRALIGPRRMPEPTAHKGSHPLLRIFDLATDTPLAPLRYVGDGGTADTRIWLCADPIHLQIRGDRLGITDTALTLTGRDALGFGAVLHALFATEDAAVACIGNRGYVGLHAIDAVVFTPLAAALGRDVQPHLPSGPAGPQWRRRLTEAQMLLHAAPLNAERIARGVAEINSAWFWGVGQLPTSLSGAFAHVWSDEPLSRGIAVCAGIACASVPVDYEKWLAQLSPGRHLLVCDTATSATLALFVHALRTKMLSGLVVVTASGQEYRLGPAHVRHWWHRLWPHKPPVARAAGRP